MTRAAVLGRPIAHSLSPVIHNAGYAALGLTDWSYTAIECDEAGLSAFVAGLGPEWAGLSLTMPLKEVALSVATSVAPVAATVGAANTLVRRPDGWHATNTDVEGMIALLSGAGVTAGARFTVLGAGGTARAAVAAAAHLAADSLTVVARRQLAIEELAAAAADFNLPLRPTLWPDALTTLDADVVISTVPKGIADPLAINAGWHPTTIVFDALYDPWPTPLAESAARAGCRILSGLDLLLAQALGQFRLFTGAEPPVEAMRDALSAARS
ncbi:shikimate dehydrogenase [Asanoa iriomotensis]|uniref:Shikimate 5-dehydrogenase n=1 Tax=Asanoa iriomotensis TaxID=234613 RepID=A0ABQ4C2L8_9ACTN|nr:shikimate dehydrogenase [Asanoa iriomotensis]GIF56999.1 shikimate 5-dehydrogenase [Asanoa iriomotensis]